MVSATEQRARITATSLLRQLEQPTAATGDEHLSTLKRQATAKHVRQLLATLHDSDSSSSSSSTSVPRGSIADLKQRLAKAEASLSLSASTSSAKAPKPAPPTSFIPNPSGNPYDPPVPMPSPLDFLLPTAPSLPASLSRPGSRAGSPAPSHHSHANLLRGAGAGDYTPSNYAPSEGYTPSAYTPTSIRTHDLDREPSFGSARESEVSLSPSRLRPSGNGSERRQRSRSTAGGPDDDYTPDAYSPIKSLKESSTPSFDFNMSGGGGVDLRKEEDEDEEGGLGLGNGSGRGRRKSTATTVEEEDGVDEEAFFGGGAKPPFPPSEETDIDPESGIGFAVEDAEGEDVDPEAGGMSFVSPSSRSHSGSVSSAGGHSARTFTPPPSATLAPPPKGGSGGGLNRRTSVSSNAPCRTRNSPSPSSLRSRRPSVPPPRISSPLSRPSHSPDQDRNELLSGLPSATPSDLLSHHHSLQTSLMDNLSSLSTQLRTNSQTFASNLEKDKAVMEGAKEKLEGNHEKMKQQQVRLKEQKGRSRGTLCWTIVVVSGVAIAWVVMFFLIKVT